MSDLISRSALIKYLNDYRWEFVYRSDFPKAVEMVDCAPAVDAVEVVRCKDCVHYYDREPVCLKIYSDCDCHQTAWQERKPNDFCSYGERRDDGNNE